MKAQPHRTRGLARPCHPQDLILVREGVQCGNCLALIRPNTNETMKQYPVSVYLNHPDTPEIPPTLIKNLNYMPTPCVGQTLQLAREEDDPVPGSGWMAVKVQEVRLFDLPSAWVYAVYGVETDVRNPPPARPNI